MLCLAAVLEVASDAVIRAGLRRRGWVVVALGATALGGCGVVVNLLSIEFSKALPGYVAFFALVSMAFGQIVFREAMPRSMWIGVSLMLIGSAVMQLGVAR